MMHRMGATARRAGWIGAILMLATGSTSSPGLARSAAHRPALASDFVQSFVPDEAIPDTPPAAPGAVDASASEPQAEDIGTGVASWYGPKFAGRTTASGETFNPAELTAAHRSLPFGSMVRVTDEDNGRSVVVRINDRGPYAAGRVIDLSEAAARQLGIVGAGEAEVSLALVTG